MPQIVSPKGVIFFLWGILVVTMLSVRPLFPIDETRYLAVAWEMWLNDEFLVPHLNGETYSHKPPLLFWLIQFSWWLFGVNEWSARLIAPLFSLVTLFLSSIVAKTLWPWRPQIADITPFILLGFFFWSIYTTLTMFDVMLTFFVVLGIYAVTKQVRTGFSFRYWILLGVAIGGGIMTKGPVILLHLLPVTLLAPWWLGKNQLIYLWKYWYAGLLLAVMIGATIALCWAVPAGIAGGEEYRRAIFLGQTSGRLVNSFAHKLPWWWYLQILPLLVLPWLCYQPFWKGLRNLTVQDTSVRFCMAWALPVFFAFSLVSGKRIHYLLPIVPTAALLIAYALDQLEAYDWSRSHRLFTVVFGVIGVAFVILPYLNNRYYWREELFLLSPLWGILICILAVLSWVSTADNVKDSVAIVCIGAVLASVLAACGFFQITGERFDTAKPAQQIAELMAQQKKIVYFGNKYHGQFHFTGRLRQPIKVINNIKDLTNYLQQQPECYAIVTFQNSTAVSHSLLSHRYPLKSKSLGILPCKNLLNNPSLQSLLVL